MTGCSASASSFPSVFHQRSLSIHLQTTDHDVIRAVGGEGGMMSVSGAVRGADGCRAGLLELLLAGATDGSAAIHALNSVSSSL